MKTGSPLALALVLAALLALTALTAWASVLPLGPFHLAVALAIALAKAALVLYFFMHLRESRGATWGYALAGLLWLTILIGLTLSDFLTRGWIAPPAA